MNIIISNNSISMIGITVILSLLIYTFPKVVREIFRGIEE